MSVKFTTSTCRRVTVELPRGFYQFVLKALAEHRNKGIAGKNAQKEENSKAVCVFV